MYVGGAFILPALTSLNVVSMFKRFFFLLFLCLCVFSSGVAFSADKVQPDHGVLKIGVWEIGPFVVKAADGTWTGLTIEIWEHIAKQLDLKYEYVPYVHHDLLNAIKTGEVDVGLSSITATHSHEEYLEYSRTYFHSNLGIASRTDTSTALMQILSTLSSSTSMSVLAVLVVVVLLAATAFWTLEKQVNELVYNSEHSKFNFFNGIIWAVLLITAQEPDVFKNKSRFGRIISLFLLVIGVTISASYIALITSAITVNQMTKSVYNSDDLPFLKVAALHESRAAEYLDEHHLKHVHFKNIHDAMDAVEAGEVDAVVADEVVLRYFTRRHSDKEISISSVNLETEYYSLAFPEWSTLASQSNSIILEFIESPLWRELLKRHVGLAAPAEKHLR